MHEIATEMDRTQSRASPTACHRCRSQKLKCSRERPNCIRCRRLNANCTYPDPPDRRRPRRNGPSSTSRQLASRDTRPSHYPDPRCDHGHGSSCHDQRHPQDRQTDSISVDRQQLTPRQGIAGVHPSSPSSPGLQYCLASQEAISEKISDVVALETYPEHLMKTDSRLADKEEASSSGPQASCALPPRAAGLSLLEVYFDRVYNASLLFFKPVLFQEYVEGKLPDYLLKAIFALASLFVTSDKDGDAGGESSEYSELRALAAFHKRSLPWAENSMKDVMSSLLQEPPIHAVQALQCLTVYWFGRQDAWRGDLCHTLAYRCCRMMKYGQRHDASSEKASYPLQLELERRCFWACWTSMCIIAQPEPYLRSAWLETAGVPLPGDIHNTPAGWRVTLSQAMNQEWQPVSLNLSQDAGDCPPVCASFMKIVGVWAKIQEFVSGAKNLPVRERFQTLSKLSSLASATYETMPQREYRAKRTQPTLEDINLLHTLDALYYMCHIALHATAVPLFSGSSLEPEAKSDDVRTSARKVLAYADQFLALLETYRNGTFDVSRISPLVGYGAFITGGIVIAYEISARNGCPNGGPLYPHQGLKKNCYSAVKVVVDLLGALRLYWRSLQLPWERLRNATAAIPHPLTSQDAPLTQSTYSPSTFGVGVGADDGLNRAEPPIRRADGDRVHHSDDPSAAPDILFQSSAEVSDARPEIRQLTTCSTPASNDLNGIDAHEFIHAADGVSMGSLFDDASDWWNLTFAEAGFPHLEGLEPANNFRGL